MNPDESKRVADMLIEIGGRTAWVLLWGGSEIMSSIDPADLPEMVCVHLLRIIRGDADRPEIIAREQ